MPIRIPTLDKKINVNLPTGIISQEGRKEIQKSVLHNGLKKLPGWWSWRLKIPTKESKKIKYVGSFPKRVGKYYHRTYGKKITPHILGAIGSLAELHTNNFNTNNFLLDFTNRFDWENGDFGDEGSCFWGDGDRNDSISDARKSMEEAGCLSVRFFDDYEEDGTNKDSCDKHCSSCIRDRCPRHELDDTHRETGYARAWVYPTTIKNRRCFIIFNGYGLQTRQIANILSIFFGCQYKQINLINNKNSYGIIYINGGTGFLLGEEKIISSIKKVDMKIECGEELCYKCDCGIFPGEELVAENNSYCNCCFDKEFFMCYSCEGTFPLKDVTTIMKTDKWDGFKYEIRVCPDCK